MRKLFPILFVALCVSQMAFAPANCNPAFFKAKPAPSGGGGGGPIAFFLVGLNGNPNDSGPNTFTGTANGSPSYTTGEDGNANHAISLNGSSQSVSFASVGTTWDFGASTSYTIGIRFKGGFQSGFPYVVGKYGDVSGKLVAGMVLNGDTAKVDISDGAHFISSDASGTVSDSAWHWGAVVVDRDAQLMHFYVDGVEVGTAKDISSVGSVDNSGLVYLGNRFDGSDHFYSGALDSCKAWNSALTLSQLITAYAHGAE